MLQVYQSSNISCVPLDANLWGWIDEDGISEEDLSEEVLHARSQWFWILQHWISGLKVKIPGKFMRNNGIFMQNKCFPAFLISWKPFVTLRTLISMRNPSTGRKGRWIVRWYWSCCMRRSSLFKITSTAFSLSPWILATNWDMDTLNSSTLHARNTHVTLLHKNKSFLPGCHDVHWCVGKDSTFNIVLLRHVRISRLISCFSLSISPLTNNFSTHSCKNLWVHGEVQKN